ncbi:GNAT family N-acetyltransferase [Aliivibrio logei]|uniref:Acetyltransferase n=1 Tax=Aliivibrio logei TaxID=688 RepID=A0A1B9NTE4_ALILO|nr:GNAT family N-acetyltransferase [Aliivibrio logei]OCH15974.1 acetyltransferase [Aliivibrio logei]
MKIDTNSLNLRDLTKDSFYAVCLLSVKPEQVNHVDSNAISIAEASFSESAWFKGIYLNDIAIGFVMVDAKPNKNKYYLWRFMIDAKYQGFGLGKRSIELLLIELKNQFGASQLTTSIVSSENSPLGFYESLGFRLSGSLIDGRERELILSF